MVEEEKEMTTYDTITARLSGGELDAMLNMFKSIFDVPTVAFSKDVVGQTKSKKDIQTDFQMAFMCLGAYLAGLANMRLSSAADFWEASVQKHGSNEFLQVVDRPNSFTYNDVDKRANQIARWAKQPHVSLKTKDVVAIMIENDAEFIWTWIGLCKAGITVALINTHLTDEALAHAIDVSKAKTVICSVRYREAWNGAHAQRTAKGLNPTVWWSIGTNPRGSLPSSANIFDDAVSQCSNEAVPRSYRKGITPDDPVFYIYTSGTTGPSKAVRFRHVTYMIIGLLHLLMRLNPTDRFYVPLPMYHTAGQVVAGSSIIARGCTMVLKESFSASTFWSDVQRYKCTAMIYIGELWRYLITRPEVPEEKNNPLRVMIGNGLRGNIWPDVVNRFQIERVVESFGQTESARGAKLPHGLSINIYGKPGACQYRPPEMRKMPGMDDTLLEFDVDSNQPKRYYSEEEGVELCRKVPHGTPGLFVIELDQDVYDNSIYTDKISSQKPLLRNVLTKGDLWYSTGDLLRIDDDGFGYFVDRTGDTFRWKGENVSTNEVCAWIEKYEGVAEANVYGVTVPEADGRAGMASIKMKTGVSLSFTDFHDYLSKGLPSYARPVFVRLTDKEAGKTSTFKFQKTHAQKEGFHPDMCAPDEVYYSSRGNPYVRITKQVYEQLTSGKLRSKL